jgi:hypothetical protein
VTGATGAKNPASISSSFFDDQPEIDLRDFDAKFQEFLAVHEPEDGRQENPTWKFFRERGYPGEGKPFKEGGWMPIFYIEDDKGGIDSFGLAFMFKLAHQRTTHDLLRNSASTHIDETTSTCRR